MFRYLSDGGESGLEQCNARIAALRREVGEKEEGRKNLEGRVKLLQKQVANAKVHAHCCMCVAWYVLHSSRRTKS